MKSLLVSVLALALLALTYALFSRGAENGFVSYDDPIYVTENQELELGLTREGLAWSLTSFEGGNWHPITWWSHLLDFELYGRENAGGHHRTSAWVHAATAAVLLLALYLLSGSLWPSAWVAAVFALHPLRVESVTWIAERKDVMAAFFWATSVLAYAWYARRPHAGRYLILLLSFALCLGSKSMGVTLPLVFLLFDAWPLGRGRSTGWARLVVEKLPLLALSAAISLATYAAQSSMGSVGSTRGFPIHARLANAALSYVEYLRQMFWPTELACFYPHPAIVEPGFSMSSPAVLGAVSILVLISLVAWGARLTRPYLAIGWCLYLGTLVPAIGFLQVGAQGHADRYTYLPSIGIAIALAWAAADTVRTSRPARRLIALAGIVSLVVLARMTWSQIPVWRDSTTLYRHAISVDPGNYVALNNLGLIHEERGELDLAENNYRAALEVHPKFPDALANMSKLLLERGEVEKARVLLELALEGDSTHVPSLANLGVVHMERREPGRARSRFEEALEIDPRHAESLRNLALLFMHAENATEALPYIERSLQLLPLDADLLHLQARALVDLGSWDEAESVLDELAPMEPDAPRAHLLRARMFEERGDVAAAIASLEEALRLAPEDPLILLSLADLHEERGEESLLASRLRRLLELAPDDIEHRNRLSWLLATCEDEELRDFDEAHALAEGTVELTKSEDAHSMATLAAVLAAQGLLGKAAFWQKKAIQLAAPGLRERLESDLERIEAARPVHAPKRKRKQR